jgi:hypothetical protein
MSTSLLLTGHSHISVFVSHSPIYGHVKTRSMRKARGELHPRTLKSESLSTLISTMVYLPCHVNDAKGGQHRQMDPHRVGRANSRCPGVLCDACGHSHVAFGGPSRRPRPCAVIKWMFAGPPASSNRGGTIHLSTPCDDFAPVLLHLPSFCLSAQSRMYRTSFSAEYSVRVVGTNSSLGLWSV